ncbi:MAG: glycosyltransferase family 4 protein [Geminicoccaceae bacterium]|nr:glycosyltransferase family 4 protein [Geminicoccaceae bacterium]
MTTGNPLMQPQVRPAVLQVLPSLESGGAERGTVQIAGALVEAGWNAVVASSGGRLERELAATGATHVTLPLASKNPLVIASNAFRLAKLARARNVRLIHARSRAPAWSAAFAARRAGISFMTTFHGVYQGHDHWLKKRYNAIMTAGDRVIAVSDYVHEHVQKVYGVDAARVRVIRRGVDLAAFDPAIVRGHRVAALSERWQLGYERKVVMLPGRVVRIKGHLLMLDAMMRMERRDFIVLIVGDLDPASSYVKELERDILRKGLTDRVHFGGHCDDMAAAYMLADVVTLPAIGPEAFGRVAIEAQAMGKPVIVTNAGGLPETVMPASTGWLVEPNNPDELAWALDLALSMETDVRERLATRARQFVADELSIDQMCRRTLDVYRELVKDAPRPSAATAPVTVDGILQEREAG